MPRRVRCPVPSGPRQRNIGAGLDSLLCGNTEPCSGHQEASAAAYMPKYAGPLVMFPPPSGFPLPLPFPFPLPFPMALPMPLAFPHPFALHLAAASAAAVTMAAHQQRLTGALYGGGYGAQAEAAGAAGLLAACWPPAPWLSPSPSLPSPLPLPPLQPGAHLQPQRHSNPLAFPTAYVQHPHHYQPQQQQTQQQHGLEPHAVRESAPTTVTATRTANLLPRSMVAAEELGCKGGRQTHVAACHGGDGGDVCTRTAPAAGVGRHKRYTDGATAAGPDTRYLDRPPPSPTQLMKAPTRFNTATAGNTGSSDATRRLPGKRHAASRVLMQSLQQQHRQKRLQSPVSEHPTGWAAGGMRLREGLEPSATSCGLVPESADTGGCAGDAGMGLTSPRRAAPEGRDRPVGLSVTKRKRNVASPAGSGSGSGSGTGGHSRAGSDQEGSGAAAAAGLAAAPAAMPRALVSPSSMVVEFHVQPGDSGGGIHCGAAHVAYGSLVAQEPSAAPLRRRVPTGTSTECPRMDWSVAPYGAPDAAQGQDSTHSLMEVNPGPNQTAVGSGPKLQTEQQQELLQPRDWVQGLPWDVLEHGLLTGWEEGREASGTAIGVAAPGRPALTIPPAYCHSQPQSQLRPPFRYGQVQHGGTENGGWREWE